MHFRLHATEIWFITQDRLRWNEGQNTQHALYTKTLTFTIRLACTVVVSLRGKEGGGRKFAAFAAVTWTRSSFCVCRAGADETQPARV